MTGTQVHSVLQVWERAALYEVCQIHLFILYTQNTCGSSEGFCDRLGTEKQKPREMPFSQVLAALSSLPPLKLW